MRRAGSNSDLEVDVSVALIRGFVLCGDVFYLSAAVIGIPPHSPNKYSFFFVEQLSSGRPFTLFTFPILFTTLSVSREIAFLTSQVDMQYHLSSMKERKVNNVFLDRRYKYFL